MNGESDAEFLDYTMKYLREAGIDEKEVARLYLEEQMALAELASHINVKVRAGILRSESASRLLRLLSIPKRSPREVAELKRAKKKGGEVPPPKESTKLSAKEKEKIVLSAYKGGESLSAIYREHGISPITAQGILAKHGEVQVRKQLEYPALLALLEEKGLDKSIITSMYMEEGYSQDRLAEEFSQLLGRPIGRKVVNSLLKSLGAKKSESQIKKSQGIRGRKMRNESMEKLERAGWSSLDTLARYYVEHPSLSYGNLAEALNEKIGEEFFTTRWVEKNISPIVKELDPPAMSRLEAGVKELAEEILGEQLISGDRKVLKGAELDLYSPSRGIAIEVNGDYWHSDRFMVANKGITAAEYHRSKWLDCKEHGIDLIFVWESDWNNNHRLTKELITEFLTDGAADPFLVQFSKPLFPLEAG